jgi:hypothetical protein
MRIRRSLVTAALALAPMALEASRPTIIVNGDPPNPTPVTGSSFNFGSNENGGGFLSFINQSGKTWFDLDVKVTLPFLTGISCGSVSFGSCSVAASIQPGSTNVNYDILFGNPNHGIINGEIFSVNLNDQNGVIINTDPNGKGSWGADTEFTAFENAPEPASIAMMLGGAGLLGGLFFMRRRRAVASN